MKISKLSEEFSRTSKYPTESESSFQAGARVALDIIRGYLSVKSHINNTVTIEELKKYIDEIDC